MKKTSPEKKTQPNSEPRPPKYNILNDWNNRVSKLHHDYQINWLRFEYVRRNKEYKKDWQEFITLPGISVNQGNSLGWTASFGGNTRVPLEQSYNHFKFKEELLSKWGIAELCDPSRPFPRFGNPMNPRTIISETGLRVRIYRNDELLHQWEWNDSEQSHPKPSEKFALEYEVKIEEKTKILKVYGFQDDSDIKLFLYVQTLRSKMPNALVFDNGKRIDLTEYHDEN